MSMLFLIILSFTITFWDLERVRYGFVILFSLCLRVYFIIFNLDDNFWISKSVTTDGNTGVI